MFITVAALAPFVERRAVGRGLNSLGRTNTQGLKITEKMKVLPLL